MRRRCIEGVLHRVDSTYVQLPIHANLGILTY